MSGSSVALAAAVISSRVLPEIVRIGPIALHSFGLMLALAFLLCGHLFALELGRRGLDPDLSGTVVTWSVVGGLVGARLYYLVEFWDEVRGHLLAAVFSGAGLVAYGGFAGAIALCWIMLRRRRAPFLRVCDAAAPFLALGYAIGRIGCFLAGDGDYGPPSDLPWAMAFPRGVVPTLERVHPTPLYETLMMFAVFAILWRLRRRSWPVGRLFATYVVLQGVERFVAEHWRLNAPIVAGMSGARFIAIVSVVSGLFWLWRLRGRDPRIAMPGGA